MCGICERRHNLFIYITKLKQCVRNNILSLPASLNQGSAVNHKYQNDRKDDFEWQDQDGLRQNIEKNRHLCPFQAIPLVSSFSLQATVEPQSQALVLDSRHSP